MMTKSTIVAIFLAITIKVFPQPSIQFDAPLDIPLILSGNFGELRSNHFHSGIDIKTNSVTGHMVRSISSGHVSRIKIRPGGYGKAIYIDHENGYTSVYGHLNNFTGEIEEYIKDLQYRLETHAFDKYLQKDVLPISRGQHIGYSGNTGSSSGPHLHFEIRKTQYQIPTNCLFYNFPIEDTIAPDFKTLVIYPGDEKAQIDKITKKKILVTERINNRYSLKTDSPISVHGKIGFGIEIYDYLNKAPNWCGIYTIEVFVDEELIYLSEMNEFSFSESRFINAHIDYPLKFETGKTVQRLCKQPYNELSIYKLLKNDGWVKINDTLTHNILIRSRDTYNNTSTLSFEIKGTGKLNNMNTVGSKPKLIIPYNAPSKFSDRNISISFPKYAFYDDVPFTYSRTNGMDGLLSDVFHVHQASTPVHRPFKMTLSVDSLPTRLSEKLCVVSISEEGNFAYAGGEFENNSITTEVREFGKYGLALDTIPPEITPLNFFKGKKIGVEPGIRFKITDELSGIQSYNGYINGHWVLFEYDPKSDLLFYEFDDRLSKSEKKYELEIVLTDNRENKTSYLTNFYL